MIQFWQLLWARPQARRWLTGLLAFSVVVIVLSQAPATPAYQVQVTPADPQLGDTLAVSIQADQPDATTPPAIAWNGNTYPAFAIAPNRWQALLPTSPLDRPGNHTLQVTGQEEPRTLAVWLRDRSFPTQRINFSPRVASIEGTDTEFDQVDAFKQIVSPQRWWSGPMQRPSSGEVSSVYGVRRYYNGVFATDYYHRGVDYAAPTGSPVVAPAAGRVVLIGRESEGFVLHGNTVGLDHGQGVLSIFIHLSRIDVQEGQMVQAGDRLGAIGATGSATGPHLHWGLYVHGVAVDPVPWRYDGF